MQNLAEAQRMLDLFTSVGAHSFTVTKTELEWPDHKKVKWGKPYPAEELRNKLPAMVRTAGIRRPIALDDGRIVMAGENLIVRPAGNVGFIQLDDLSSEQLERLRPAAFLMHATSPGNHQAWIAISDAPTSGEPFKDLMRRVRKAVGSNDKSASGATRLSGTENWKAKNLPDPPVVTIVHAVPGRAMTPERLKEFGLLAEPEPVQFTEKVRTRKGTPYRDPANRKWPSYQMSLAGAPMNKAGTGPDRSSADFWWSKLAVQWGWEIEETIPKLLEVSDNAKRRAADGDVGYARITVENAAAAVATKSSRQRA